MGLPLIAPFTCSQCGDCCRGLVARPTAAWPEAFAAGAPGGYYGLPSRGGLAVWAWERPAFVARLVAAGHLEALTPALALVEATRVIILRYDLTAPDKCPLLVAGESAETWICSAYGARPLVCRAFPVVVADGGLAPSSACPEVVPPATATPDVFAATFGSGYHAARFALDTPRRVAHLMTALTTAGLLQPLTGLSQHQVGQALETLPRLDLMDVAHDIGFDLLGWWREQARAFPIADALQAA